MVYGKRLILTQAYMHMLFLTLSGGTCAVAETENLPGADSNAALIPIDVALAPGGILHGRILDENGRTRNHAEIRLHRPHGNLVRIYSAADGTFAIPGIQGGSYQIIYGESSQLVRAWAADTAPPGAADCIVLRTGDPLIRAQWAAPQFLNNAVRGGKVAMTNPVVAGGVLAAAVGIPVFVHNVNQDDAPVSP